MGPKNIKFKFNIIDVIFIAVMKYIEEPKRDLIFSSSSWHSILLVTCIKMTHLGKLSVREAIEHTVGMCPASKHHNLQSPKPFTSNLRAIQKDRISSR